MCFTGAAVRRNAAVRLRQRRALRHGGGGGGASPTHSPAASGAASEVSTLDFYKDTQRLGGDEGALCAVSYPALYLSQEDGAGLSALARTVASFNADAASSAQGAYTQLSAAAQEAYARHEQELPPRRRPGTQENAPAEFEGFTRDVDVTLPARGQPRRESAVLHDGLLRRRSAAQAITQREHRRRKAGACCLSATSSRDGRASPALEDGLRASYPEADFTGLEDALNSYMADPSTFTWTLDYQGISFYFSPGELAPCQRRALHILHPLRCAARAVQPLLHGRPAAYAIPLTGGECINFDMDKNGQNDSIRLEYMGTAATART